MTVTDPYTGIGVITRGVFDSDMAAISLSLHSSCNDIALNEKNSPSFCQIHFYRGIFHLLSSCTLSTLRAFNSSSFHPSSPQIHPFSMIPVTPQKRGRCQYPHLCQRRVDVGDDGDLGCGVGNLPGVSGRLQLPSQPSGISVAFREELPAEGGVPE